MRPSKPPIRPKKRPQQLKQRRYVVQKLLGNLAVEIDDRPPQAATAADVAKAASIADAVKHAAHQVQIIVNHSRSKLM